MKIHEYQARQILSENGIPVPAAEVVRSPQEAAAAFNKFISYYLFPEARYSVGVTLASRAKISIGANPWSKVPRTHEINKICERYGGGGHPVVGAISIPRAELPRAREIARQIVAELNT